MKKILSLFLLTASFLASAQSQLKSGPMLGAVEMREVKIWIQTKQAAQVYIKFWEQENQNPVRKTDAFTKQKHKAFTHTFILDSLEPGRTYQYQVVLSDQPMDKLFNFTTQELFQYRKDPPSFSFAIGSCNYNNELIYDRPGEPYGAGQGIFSVIDSTHPDFMIWLGDNVYLREADWYSRTGIYHRYSYSRKAVELQSLLSNSAHYAIWDDHDYGPNDANRSYRDKHITYEAFKDFWANPSYGRDGQGIYSSFQWADCDFFLLDNRTFRYPNERSKEKQAGILGQEQLEWLIDGLSSSKAPFKFVCVGGQVLNTAAIYENHAIFKKERKQLLKAIRKNKISGVIFLTGDRHHSAFAKKKHCFAPDVYEVTASPLSSKVYPPKEKNKNLVKGSIVLDQNFGRIRVAGNRKSRSVQVELIDHTGKPVWDTIIYEQDAD